MIYGLTEADLQRIDKEAVKKMIAEEENGLIRGVFQTMKRSR